MRTNMELWTEIRRRVLTKELSQRTACQEYKLGWWTLKKILANAEPPGYQRTKPRARPKLERFLPIIHEILKDDQQAPKKQRHTAQRIWERLREEHGFQGCYSSVKQAVRKWRQERQEVFLPLSHPPGEAQVDFGEALVKVTGQPHRTLQSCHRHCIGDRFKLRRRERFILQCQRAGSFSRSRAAADFVAIGQQHRRCPAIAGVDI